MKIRVCNYFQKNVELFLEPWGEDYLMRPNDTFEIVAVEADSQTYFEVDFGEHISVYLEGSRNAYAHIYHNGQKVECGYQRL